LFTRHGSERSSAGKGGLGGGIPDSVNGFENLSDAWHDAQVALPWCSS
jgi:hypothetical protein